MHAAITHPPGEAVAECVHDTSDAGHGTSGLSRRDFSLVNWHNDGQESRAYACDHAADSKHGYCDRTCVDCAADDENHTPELDCAFSSNLVRSPCAEGTTDDSAAAICSIQRTENVCGM
jgi:hypothetical protein